MTADVEFCLPGPLLVRCGGVAVPVPPGKQRVLLAALLLSANRMVPVDELAEALWGSGPPASARPTLQNYVKRLRQALADAGGGRISTLPGGYLIQVDAGELDVSRFEALQESAREAARAGAWDLAAAELRAALSLWRGEPLVNVPSELLSLREVPRLAEARLQAVEARIDAELHLGHHADVIAELRQLAGVHSLRERLHALLMLALYRDGQKAEVGTSDRRPVSGRPAACEPARIRPIRDAGHARGRDSQVHRCAASSGGATDPIQSGSPRRPVPRPARRPADAHRLGQRP